MKKDKFCINCNSKLNRNDKTYCNAKCQQEYQYNQYITRWKNGLETGISGKYQISNYIIRYMREKYKNKCSRCGWNKINPTTGKVPLEIEHIDGNYKNNVESNLDLICPNCHSLTSTYRGLNKGNGRKSRKKYSG